MALIVVTFRLSQNYYTKLQVREVVEHRHENERVVIDVLENADLEDYLILDTTYTHAHKVSNKLRHSFWFPEQKVSKDDAVILYTKKGTAHSKKNSKDGTNYFYYWQLDSNIWNDDGDAVVIFELRALQTIQAKP